MNRILERIYIWLLLLIFAGIVVHAPLSVGFGSLWPEYDLAIKAWKEVLMLIAVSLFVIILTRRKMWHQVWSDKLWWIVAGYAALHLIILTPLWQGATPGIAGLLIDLRYVLFFALAYGATVIYPEFRKIVLKILAAGAALVLGFALLQVTVLPKDILQHIGYGGETIAPYLTVDNNPEYVRINSTLRGPNPLGAYAAGAMALIAAFWVGGRVKSSRAKALAVAGFVAALVALWFSYSRSAMLAAGLALGLVLAITYWSRITRPVVVALALACSLLIGFVVIQWETPFVQHVILHEDPNEGNDINSNEGHIDSLAMGVQRMFEQPFGAGIGSTGSASLYGDSTVIIENQYLFVAHEVGWLGLALFIVLITMVMIRLWRQRTDWLALGVWASGCGLLVIGILLPVFVDDTISIIWWGLAGLVLGGTNDSRTLK